MTISRYRVLVVEDETLVALDLMDNLMDAGCDVVGTAGDLKSALHMARTVECDSAILDLNLAGLRVDPVADILKERGIPFVFATGYGAAGLPLEHAGAPVVEKPYDFASVQAALAKLRGDGPGL